MYLYHKQPFWRFKRLRGRVLYYYVRVFTSHDRLIFPPIFMCSWLGWMDVSRLVEGLCDSLLREALQDTSRDYLLNWFRRPSSWWVVARSVCRTILSIFNLCCLRKQWTEEEFAHAVKKLKCVAFDRLILRKWEWFDSSEHRMSPQSRCLTLAYSLGCTEHVQVAIEELKESVLVENDAILQFLCLLAGKCIDEEGRTLDDSGLCLSGDILFAPRVADVDSVKVSLLASKQVQTYTNYYTS